MVRVEAVRQGSDLERKLLEFVESCSWTQVKDHIADLIKKHALTGWETFFAAVSEDRIVGMASLMKTDYYPLPDIFPYVSCIFVTEDCRGHRISGKLIDFANSYAKEHGFDRTYIPTEHIGLYERYGYRFAGEIVNYGGGVDRLYSKDI